MFILSYQFIGCHGHSVAEVRAARFHSCNFVAEVRAARFHSCHGHFVCEARFSGQLLAWRDSIVIVFMLYKAIMLCPSIPLPGIRHFFEIIASIAFTVTIYVITNLSQLKINPM